MTVIAVVNHSRIVSAAETRLLAAACDLQLQRDCAPLWGATPWRVRYYARTATLPGDAIPIVLFDTPDEPDALGYHSETPDGRRYGRVFVEPILDAGGSLRSSATSVSVTLSHEVLEAFIDPDVNLWAVADTGELYAYEICDPVESDAYRLRVHHRLVHVSDFVLRSWFDSENPANTRFDYLDRVPDAFSVLSGGYTVYWDETGEHEFFGHRYPRWRKGGKTHPAARTARRLESAC